MVALATVAARLSAVDVDAATVMDIPAVAESALDHIADRFGILGTVAWRRAQDAAEKRDLLKRSLQTQRLKGTRAGIDEAARNSGSQIVRVITPPARMYLGGALTDEQRAEWLSKHAQLRIYNERNRGQAPRGAAYAGSAYLDGSYATAESDAPLLARPRTFLFRKGQETELTTLDYTDTQTQVQKIEAREPGSAKHLTFAGHSYLGHSYLGRDTGARNYRVELAEPYTETTRTWTRLERSSDLDFISIKYDQVSEPYTAHCLFAGQYLADAYLAHDNAGDHVYRRFWLLDPDAPEMAAKTHAWVGGRLGIEPHRADIQIYAPVKRAGIYAGGSYVGQYLNEPDMTPVHDAMEAQVEMMRFSDRIRISTTTKEILTASQTIRAGEYLAGQYVPVYI